MASCVKVTQGLGSILQKVYELIMSSDGNSHRSASPRPTTLEEDQGVFVNFSSIWCLLFKIQGMRTYNFFDWVSNTESESHWQKHAAVMGQIKTRSGHSFATQLSWHVQNIDLIESSQSMRQQREFSRNFNYEIRNHLWNGFLLTPKADFLSQRLAKSWNSETHFKIVSVVTYNVDTLRF